METFADFQLGETEQLVQVATSAEVADASLALMRQARRKVDIVTRHLDPLLYDLTAFHEATREFCQRSSRQRLRIVILDPAPLVTRGHRLLELAYAKSSFVSLRVPGVEHERFNEAFFIADETGYLWRKLSDRFDAEVNFHGRMRARELTDLFNQIWDKGDPDPNLRKLNI